jgi:hypothetical protein
LALCECGDFYILMQRIKFVEPQIGLHCHEPTLMPNPGYSFALPFFRVLSSRL